MRRDRAVSNTLGYSLTLAIATILVTGLLIAGTGFVEDRREQVVRDELTVIAQQVTSDITRADRLVIAADSSGSDLTVRMTQTFPERVTGSTYRVALDPPNDRLVVESTNLKLRVTVGLRTETQLRQSASDGGSIRIAYNESEDALEVRDV